MRRADKWPLKNGTTVYPTTTVNYPHRGGLQEIIEGQAIIEAPAMAPHHYEVRFLGEIELCVRGPLDESHVGKEGMLS